MFDNTYTKSGILNEALNQARVEETDLNITKIKSIEVVDGKDDKEKLENLIKAIDELKARVGIKATIKEYGIDEKDFLDNLDEMVEQAFDDQCTGANPRYPLMSEIKDMYLKAYYGK